MSKSSSTSSSDLNVWINRRFKRSSFARGSSGEAPAPHHQLIKEIEQECAFFEHTLNLEELDNLFPLTRISLTDPKKSRGLNKDETLNRLAKDGRNIVDPISGKATLRRFLAQFLNTFRMLLLIVSVICFIIFALDTSHLLELYLAVTLIVVFLFLCAISYWQEWSAHRQVRGFQSMISTSCIVVRSGTYSRVNAAEIVVGDLVYLRPGIRVPADLRLIYADGLRMETSWISGELEALEFKAKPVKKGVSAFESQNIAFNSCLCIRGEGLGVVIRTGNNSVVGKLMKLTSLEDGAPTRLAVEHAHFVRFVTLLAIGMGAVTFLIGLAVHKFTNVVYTFVNGFLVIIVASVPQGLPITLGATLIIVARRLAKKKLFMKRLDVAETLGTATVVMCDKTAVFTSNNITVTDVWRDLQYFKGAPEGRRRRADEMRSICLSREEDHFPALLAAMSVCNKAQIESVGSGNFSKWRRLSAQFFQPNFLNLTPLQNGISQIENEQYSVQSTNNIRAALHHKSIIGHPNEVALLKYVESIASVQSIRNSYEVVYELPFTGQRRSHVVVARDKDSVPTDDADIIRFYMFVKGAPEELLKHCTRMATSEGESEMSEDLVDQFAEAYMKFGGAGCSCIAFAMTEFEALADIQFSVQEGCLPEYDLCFLGMAAMYDPPRDDIRESLSTLRSAGIKCFMVTGDHPSTAAAVAKHIGLIGSSLADNDGNKKENPNDEMTVIHGHTLDKMTSEQWDAALAQPTVVFARTTPAQKLVIVKECQRRNEVVAVTGDGVLSAPALKKADIGIAMEAVGSVFAKEAADMVLVDSDLKNIVKGIKEGRLMYDNLKKAIAYTLTHLMPELYAVLMTFTFGFPLGLSSLQVLTIDLLTELPPSTALTFEPAERDIMKKKPRSPSSKLVSRALLAYSYLFAGNIISVGCIIAYFSVFWYHGISTGELVYTAHSYWHAASQNFTSRSGLIFTCSQQMHIAGQASAAWHITLVMSQAFHVWMCATRRVSIFRHRFTNLVAVFAILLEILLLNFFIYTPGVQTWLTVNHPPAFTWLFCFPVAIALLIFNETRKLAIRRWPLDPLVRIFKW